MSSTQSKEPGVDQSLTCHSLYEEEDIIEWIIIYPLGHTIPEYRLAWTKHGHRNSSATPSTLAEIIHTAHYQVALNQINRDGNKGVPWRKSCFCVKYKHENELIRQNASHKTPKLKQE